MVNTMSKNQGIDDCPGRNLWDVDDDVELHQTAWAPGLEAGRGDAPLRGWRG